MVEVTADDRATLESWIRATTTEQRLVLRARIVLALALGQTNREVADALSVRPATVSKWRTRFGRVLGVSGTPRAQVNRPPTAKRRNVGCSLNSMSLRPPGTPAGTERSSPKLWVTSPRPRSGASCAATGSRLSAGAADA